MSKKYPDVLGIQKKEDLIKSMTPYDDSDNLIVNGLKSILGPMIQQDPVDGLNRVAMIIELFGNTCRHCWTNSSKCQCNNDD